MRGAVDRRGGFGATGSHAPTGATNSQGIPYGSEFFLESRNGNIQLGHYHPRIGGGQVDTNLTYDEARFATT